MAPSYFVQLLGALLFGNLFNYGLFGALSIQVYFYILTFPKDRMALKVTVFLTYLLDAVQTGLATYLAWDIFVHNWGNLMIVEVGIPPWTLGTLSPLSGIVALLVQFFFAWRIYVLASSRYIIPVVGAIILTGIASFAMAIAFGITVDQNLSNVPVISLRNGSAVMYWTTGFLCDLLITLTLVIQFRSKQDHGFVNDILHRAIRMALETGAIMCAVSVIQVILYATPIGLIGYSLLLLIVSGKIYSNSLMASLNSRAPIFRRRQSSDTEVFQTSDGTEIHFVTST